MEKVACNCCRAGSFSFSPPKVKAPSQIHNATSALARCTHRWASMEIKATKREGENKSVLSKVQPRAAAKMGLGNFPRQTFIVGSPPLPSSLSIPPPPGNPLLQRPPSFISSSHRERWTAPSAIPLKSLLEVTLDGSGSSGGRIAASRNYWRSLQRRRRLPDNKGTQ